MLFFTFWNAYQLQQVQWELDDAMLSSWYCDQDSCYITSSRLAADLLTLTKVVPALLILQMIGSVFFYLFLFPGALPPPMKKFLVWGGIMYYAIACFLMSGFFEAWRLLHP